MPTVSPARLGILISGAGSTYVNLATAIADGRLPATIAVVVSSRADAAGLERARGFGHPTAVAATPDEVTAALRAHGATWVAMCGWLKYWDPPAEYRQRTINIHPSLLPDFGGKGMYGIHVHRAVLAAGRTRSGCSVHLVTGDYDSGPILARHEVPVLPDDTALTLQSRVQAAERDLYPATLAALLAASSTGSGSAPAT